MRRKWLIEKPFYFGAMTAVASVLIGIPWVKTLEQQAVNVVLGFAAGALTSCLVLLAERYWNRRSRERKPTSTRQGPTMEDLRQAYERIEAAKRTVLCGAEHEDAVQTALDRANVAGMFKVQVSDVLPENTVVVMDEQAIRASFRQNLSNPMTFDHPTSWFEMDRARLLRDIRNGGAQLWRPAEGKERSDP